MDHHRTLPMQNLERGLVESKLVKFFLAATERFEGVHLKELAVSAVGPHRELVVDDRKLVNFGFDSFLGLDQDVRLKDALSRGAQRWGTQFGASRAFASCGVEVELETKIAAWIGTEAALIYPSVTLANYGALPALTEPQDLLVVDEFAHNSIVEGSKAAKANGVRVVAFAHNSADSLERVLVESQPYRTAIIAIDGVYSMSGSIAALKDLDEVARRHNAVLYIDDAHATGVLGAHGRGTVFDALGDYDNAVVVGCLSKACSVFGAFIACSHKLQRLLKMRSNTYIFGGPVPPPYLEAILTVIDILTSDEYGLLRSQLDRNIERMLLGLRSLGLVILGGRSPIISVLVGDEEATFSAGRFLFDQGYYVQSVIFPAVPYHAGVLRIQVNSNHRADAIDGLVDAFDSLSDRIEMPRTSLLERPAA
jgi:glycine C-acetyltransferase